MFLCDMFKASVQHYENVANEGAIPSIYVDKRVLDVPSCKIESRNCYTINGAEFYDYERIDDGIVEFELYQRRVVVKNKMEGNDYDTCCSTPPDCDLVSENAEDSTAPLPITIQMHPNGVLINSIIFLASTHWHTLVAVEDHMVSCVVCSEYCEVGASGRHVESDRHNLYMKMYKPLERFELSITRKVNESYHCGVCNEVFDQSGLVEHFSSKMHEGNLLFAINKASDIIYDEVIEPNNNIEKSNCYHFNANNIIEEHNSHYDDDDDYVPSNYDFIDYKQNDFVEYDDDDDYYSEFSGKQFTGTSYATMAKKPIIDQKRFFDIDLGNKTVKVRFNSWHMVINPQQGRFYCMVCKQFDHIRLKLEHCQDYEHLTKLAGCKVVQMFQDHFIRRVDNKLYHCGHCNNLQLVNQMQYHIDTVHPKKQKTVDKDQKPLNGLDVSINKKIEEVLPEQNNANNPLFLHRKNGKVNETNNLSDKSIDIFKRVDNFDVIIINPFGYKMLISKLAYNMVCKRLENFYCCLCDVTFDEDEVPMHLRQPGHQQTLHRIPFIRPFGCNLIRAVREVLHCSVCNMPISAEKIYTHLVDPIHVIILKKILNEADNDSTNDKNSQSQTKLPKTDTSVTKQTSVKKEPVKLVLKAAATKEFDKSSVKKGSHLVVKEINNDSSQITKSPVKKKITERVRNDSERSINSCNNDIQTTNIFTNDDTTKINHYEEFGIVPNIRHSTEEETEDLELTFDSNASDEVIFDNEEYVYLKLKNTYIKISNSAYHTLVFVGDGSRYCFVCSIQVHYADVSKHVDSRSHTENLEKLLFLDKYEDHLLRQIYLNYHCSVCNVIVTRKEVKNHLDWPTHALQIENTQRNIKKARKTEIKGGVKQVIISTQKENIYLNEKESTINIHYHVKVVANKKSNVESDPSSETTEAPANSYIDYKKSKIIIFNDNVLKFSWERWHGVARVKNGLKCNLCQMELREDEIETHCNSEWHKYALDKPYETQFAPALIRKVNESTLNCLICNTEVSNKEQLVKEHIKGKKHKNNYETIVKESSTTNTYSDCIGDVLMLEKN